jgi:signal peptidase I
LPQREIERGDIIVFKFPGFPDYLNKSRAEKEAAGTPYQINFVKRVVGLPGDKIEVKENRVFVNDQPLAEHRIIGDAPSGQSEEQSALQTTEFEPRKPEDQYDVYYSSRNIKAPALSDEADFAAHGKPYIVPENSYFVMGDSRNRSLDSRYWGPVSRDLIIGRAMFVYWSCDRAAGDGGVLGCLTNPRLERIGKLIK